MSNALAVAGSGFVSSATGSTGFASGGGVDFFDSPHSTNTTAAIVVSGIDFISRKLSYR